MLYLCQQCTADSLHHLKQDHPLQNTHKVQFSRRLHLVCLTKQIESKETNCSPTCSIENILNIVKSDKFCFGIVFVASKYLTTFSHSSLWENNIPDSVVKVLPSVSWARPLHVAWGKSFPLLLSSSPKAVQRNSLLTLILNLPNSPALIIRKVLKWYNPSTPGGTVNLAVLLSYLESNSAHVVFLHLGGQH